MAPKLEASVETAIADELAAEAADRRVVALGSTSASMSSVAPRPMTSAKWSHQKRKRREANKSRARNRRKR